MKEKLILGKDFEVLSEKMWKLLCKCYPEVNQTASPLIRSYERIGLGMRTQIEYFYHEVSLWIYDLVVVLSRLGLIRPRNAEPETPKLELIIHSLLFVTQVNRLAKNARCYYLKRPTGPTKNIAEQMSLLLLIRRQPALHAGIRGPTPRPIRVQLESHAPGLLHRWQPKQVETRWQLGVPTHLLEVLVLPTNGRINVT